MRYIFYKLLNSIYVLFKTTRCHPLLRSYGKVNTNISCVFFDFTHRTTHFGDRLFFFPLIIFFLRKNIPVKLACNDHFTKELFYRLYKLDLHSAPGPALFDLVIYPLPSFQHFFKHYRSAMLIDFTDSQSADVITSQLIYSFSKYFLLQYDRIKNSYNPVPCENSSSFLDDSRSEYFLFSNYIQSGRFRKHFSNKYKLVQKACALKRLGYKIIHVGSIDDASTDHQHYEFVDIDLRGKTSISDLIDLVESPSVLGAITYDNFLMHLVGMYGKVAYVLFRGRFSRKNHEHHMLHVNNTFFDQKDKLFYL